MTIQEMAAIAGMISTAGQAGMALVGGAKALIALFGMKEPSAEEQAAITALVIADATRRGDERRQMAGL
jgi:hypothetical protein